jgi:hypothetical protein
MGGKFLVMLRQPGAGVPFIQSCRMLEPEGLRRPEYPHVSILPLSPEKGQKPENAALGQSGDVTVTMMKDGRTERFSRLRLLTNTEAEEHKAAIEKFTSPLCSFWMFYVRTVVAYAGSPKGMKRGWLGAKAEHVDARTGITYSVDIPEGLQKAPAMMMDDYEIRRSGREVLLVPGPLARAIDGFPGESGYYPRGREGIPVIGGYSVEKIRMSRLEGEAILPIVRCVSRAVNEQRRLTESYPRPAAAKLPVLVPDIILNISPSARFAMLALGCSMDG